MTPADMAEAIDSFLGEGADDPYAWSGIMEGLRTKDPEMRAILGEGERAGAFVDPSEYAGNRAACEALRTVARRLRELQAMRNR